MCSIFTKYESKESDTDGKNPLIPRHLLVPGNLINMKKSEIVNFSIDINTVFFVLRQMLIANIKVFKEGRGYVSRYGTETKIKKRSTDKILNILVHAIKNVNPEMLWEMKSGYEFNDQQKYYMEHLFLPHTQGKQKSDSDHSKSSNFTMFSMIKYSFVDNGVNEDMLHATCDLLNSQIKLRDCLISDHRSYKRVQKQIHYQKKKMKNLIIFGFELECMLTKLFRIMLSRNILPYIMGLHRRLGNEQKCMIKMLDVEVNRMIIDFYIESFSISDRDGVTVYKNQEHENKIEG